MFQTQSSLLCFRREGLPAGGPRTTGLVILQPTSRSPVAAPASLADGWPPLAQSPFRSRGASSGETTTGSSAVPEDTPAGARYRPDAGAPPAPVRSLFRRAGASLRPACALVDRSFPFACASV